MDDALAHLLDRLQDLEQRISIRTSDPNERPVWVHWSDAQILNRAIEALKSQNGQIVRVRDALGIALQEVGKR